MRRLVLPPLYRLSPRRVLWLLLLLSTTRTMPPNNGNNNGGGMANANILPDNRVEASFRLALPAGDLRRGNAVQVSRDDRFLWVSTAEGALHKIRLSNGSDDAESNEQILTYTPTSSTSVRCQSGVVETASNKLVLYNVQFDDGTDTSAVLAVDALTLELQWNVTVVGQLQGTPVLSDNDYLYVTHQSTAVPFGQLTVIPLAAERAVATLALEGTTEVTAPTVVFDDATGGDIVYVAAAEGEGLLFAVTWADAHMDNQGAGAQSYRVVQASNLAGAAVAPPAATLDGAVYLGQESSTLLGWENVLQDPVPAWGYSFAAPAGGGRDSALEPIPVTPVLSDDNQYLFLAAAGNEIAGLRLDQGLLAWSDDTVDAPVRAAARYFLEPGANPREAVVYFAVGSNIRQYQAEDGDLNWNLPFCENTDNSGDCPEVHAAFSLNSIGNMLYYGDRDGNLVGVRVADFETAAPTPEPTAVPTTAPITVAPTSAPIKAPEAPVAAPVELPVTGTPVAPPVEAPTTDPDDLSSSNQEQESSSSSSSSSIMEQLPLILGVICGVLLVLIGFVILKRRSRNRKNARGVDGNPTEDTSDDDEEAAARRSLNEKIALVLQGQEEGNVTTPTSKRGGSNNGGTPATLTSIAETPENYKDDGTVDAESVGYEIKSVAEDEPHAVRNLEETFSVASSTADKPNGGGGEEEEAAVASVASASVASSGAPSGTNQHESSSNSINSNASPKNSAAAAAALEASSTASQVTSNHESNSSSIRRSFMSQSLMEKVAAAGAAVSAAVAGGAVRRSSEEEEKKETDSVQATRKWGDRSIRKTKSGDQTILSTQSGDQSIRMTKSGDQTIHTTQSGDQSIRVTKSDDQTITVSPLNSPTPSYLSNEPGRITAYQRPSSPAARTASPVGSLASLDESLYIDESTIASLELPGDGHSLAEALGMNGQPVDASDCPEDEIMGKVRPGSHYLSRHQAKKDQDVVKAAVVPAKTAPTRSKSADRSRPMYKGVSVRPSRSRAGLFSRRQPPLKTADPEDEDSSAELPAPRASSVPPPRPAGKVDQKLSNTPSASPPPKSTGEEDSLSQSSAPKFTRAGYYVEESEKEKESPADPWSSFLNELSKVEDQFFNPTAASKAEGRSRAEGDNNNAEESDTDVESLEPPPPAPRTFYA